MNQDDSLSSLQCSQLAHPNSPLHAGNSTSSPHFFNSTQGQTALPRLESAPARFSTGPATAPRSNIPKTPPQPPWCPRASAVLTRRLLVAKRELSQVACVRPSASAVVLVCSGTSCRYPAVCARLLHQCGGMELSGQQPGTVTERAGVYGESRSSHWHYANNINTLPRHGEISTGLLLRSAYLFVCKLGKKVKRRHPSLVPSLCRKVLKGGRRAGILLLFTFINPFSVY